MKTQAQIYVLIPEDSAYRPVQAQVVGENLYKILPTPEYDPEDAEWEFPPGTIVRCEERNIIRNVIYRQLKKSANIHCVCAH